MTLPPYAPARIPAKPQTRLTEAEASLSSGKRVRPQMYVVGWPDGIIKVGCTSHGRQRWGGFLTRGGIMLDIGYYPGADSVYAEVWLQEQLEKTYQPAFRSKEEAKPYLGNSGAGYLECFLVPVSDWPAVVELSRS